MKMYLVLEFFHQSYWDMAAESEYRELVRHRFEKANTKEEVEEKAVEKATEFIKKELEERYEKAKKHLGKEPMWTVDKKLKSYLEELVITVHEANENKEEIHTIDGSF